MLCWIEVCEVCKFCVEEVWFVWCVDISLLVSDVEVVLFIVCLLVVV